MPYQRRMQWSSSKEPLGPGNAPACLKTMSGMERKSLSSLKAKAELTVLSSDKSNATIILNTTYCNLKTEGIQDPL
jgi:hypothetical protein